MVHSPDTVSTFVVFIDFPDHACDCFIFLRYNVFF